MSKKIAMLSAVAAGLLVGGCANDKKNEQQASMEKYKVLSGSTSNEAPGTDKFDVAREPALNPDTRFAAGQLAESQGKMDCAMVQYEQALRLDAKHVPSLYRMGVVLTKVKQYEKAVTIWKRYIDATNNTASGYSNLAFTYEMAGNVEQAEESYKSGLAIDAKSQPCRVNYGLMLARNNRTVEAEMQLAAVLEPAEVAYNLAAIYEQQGAIGQAREQLKKALEVNPNMVEAQTKLATLPMD
ncbi:MAG TPA: tetratricopeptide repeat protein [Tepidisphaeraceae bacterium]|nr:tetratricopeptide repeat protein [Tepidisphaeraceae bacterium]